MLSRTDLHYTVANGGGRFQCTRRDSLRGWKRKKKNRRTDVAGRFQVISTSYIPPSSPIIMIMRVIPVHGKAYMEEKEIHQ